MNAGAVLLLALAAAAVLSCGWPGRARPVAIGLAVTVFACWAGVLGAFQPVAWGPSVLLFGAAVTTRCPGPRGRIGWAVFIALALAMAFGAVPGFVPVALTDLAPLKAGSPPLQLQLGVGKVLVAVALLCGPVPRAATASWQGRTALGVGLLTAVGVPALAAASGLVRWSPGAPAWPVATTWALLNLLLVCTLEEGFFRGVVQRALARVLPVPAAIVLAAALFGVAHLGGGPLYALLAALAGVGYGVVYRCSGERLPAAMLAHFGLNAVHLLGFTYPAG